MTSSINSKSPINVIIVIGLAGSGKTVFVNSIHEKMMYNKNKHFIINLDAGVKSIPYLPNVDIRDTIDITDLIINHKIGPNSAIITAVNLFITKFNELIEIIKSKYYRNLEFIVVDTPGQIEVFLWSISGFIIVNLLKYSYKTIILFLVDMKKASNFLLLISNLLYCLSIMFKTKTKILIIFNKTANKSKHFWNYLANQQSILNYEHLSSKTYIGDLINLFLDLVFRHSLGNIFYNDFSSFKKKCLNEFFIYLCSI
mmetsp:Transcript_2400/g.3592  ORF Transcript_2400/g.3592 Transcript_2400/m.3592 type:complete len:256 (-) Transcript_2400:5202-5969(-)